MKKQIPPKVHSLKLFYLLLFVLIIPTTETFAQNVNIAPLATVTASTCNTGACSTLNDLSLGTCGSQEMWITTNTPPDPTIGVNYIEWNWTSPKSFNKIIIHHAEPANRSLTGGIFQRWDGSSWITVSSFSNLTQQCINTVDFPVTTTSRFRITAFQMTGTGQLSNPNFREIEIIQAILGPNNAGVLAIDSPAYFCPGTYDILTTIGNFGVNQITTVTVNWSINGVTQLPVLYTNVLDTLGGTGSSTALINLGSHIFTAGVADTILVWTTNPNLTTDSITFNDSVMTVKKPSISGTYTIGAIGDYLNFTAAAYDLNTFGICGSVVFNVDASSGPYNEQISLSQIGGANSANTVIFNGNNAVITFNANDINNRHIIRLNGADHVTIDNLNIQVAPSSVYGWPVYIATGSNYNTINNCRLVTDANSTSTNFAGLVMSGSASSPTTALVASNNTITNNIITGGYYGMTMVGTAGASNVSNNLIANNTIKNFYVYGMYLSGIDSSVVRSNEIQRANRTSLTTFYGLFIGGNSARVVIEKNRIHSAFNLDPININTAYGLFVSANDAPLGQELILRNNLVYKIDNGIGSVYGFYNSSSDGAHYYHNTISMDNTASTAGAAYGFYQTTLASNINFKNNIISITRGGSGAKTAVYLNTATSIVKSDYNDLFVSSAGSGAQNIGRKTTDFATLVSWQTAGYDSNSVAVNPIFSLPQAGNFSPLNQLLDSAAIPIAGITDDILNNPRDTAAPDIGAFEFTPQPYDVAVVAVAGPLPNNCYSTTEDIIVAIKNTGTLPIDFSVNNVTVSAEITGTISQTLNFTINSNIINGGNPLASLGTLNVAVGTADLTTQGIYQINAYTTMALDVTVFNDTLYDLYTLNVSPGNASPDSMGICEGSSTTLSLAGATGSTIQWQYWDGTTWVNETGAGYDSVVFVSSPIVNTMYRALVCSTLVSDTASIYVTTVSIPSLVTGGTVCGFDSILLSAVGNGLKWYDDSVGGNLLDTGATYTPFITSTDTFFVSSSAGGGLAAPLTTTFAAGNGSNGNMFDITALNTLTITNFDGHTSGGTSTWEIWYRPGSFVGFESSNAGWTLLGSAVNVPSAGTGQPTPIPVNFNVTIPAGQTYGFYVTTTAGTTVAYTNGVAVGNVYASDQNIQFKEGKGGSYFGVTIATRIWNGRIHYSAGCESPRVPVIAISTPAPAISATPATSTICMGDSATLSVSSANAGYVYTWSPATGLNTTVGASVIASPIVNSTYMVLASDAISGCNIIDTVSVTVEPLPVLTVTSVEVCNGSPANLMLTGTSSSIQWQSFNGTSWVNESGPGSNTSTYSVIPSASTDYRAYVCGNHLSDTLTVNVITVAAPVAFGDTVCGTDTAHLTAIGNGLKWYTAASGGSPVDTGAVYSTTLSATTTYYVAATTGGGAGTPLSTTLAAGNSFLGNMFDITALNTVTITNFDGHSAAGTFDWEVWYRTGSFVGFTGSNAGWTLLGSATGVVSNGTGTATPIPVYFSVTIPAGQTAAFYVTALAGTVNYTNGTPVGNVYASDANIQFKIGNGGGYFSVANAGRIFNGKIYYTAGCEGPRTPVIAALDSGFAFNMGADTIMCANSSLTLDAGAGYTSYEWYDNTTLQTNTVQDGGTYYVTVTNPSGCIGSDTIVVNEYPDILLDLGNDTTICNTCTLTLDAGPGFTDYLWQDNSPAQTYNVPADTGTFVYYVTVFDVNGCSKSDTIVIHRSNVGVEEKSFDHNLYIQPNPSSGIFKVTYTGKDLKGKGAIEIRNMEGQLVYLENFESLISGHNKQIDLHHVAKGIYFVKIKTVSETYYNRIVIQ